MVDLTVTLADGGECISDLITLRQQPDLFVEVASTPTAWRVLESMDEEMLARLMAAVAKARARGWKRGLGPQLVTLDFDATLVEVEPENKEHVAPNWKHGFGCHTLLVYLDQTGEQLGGILSPATPVPTRPEDPERGLEVLVGSDSAGASHGFVNAIVSRGLEFSVGFDLTAPVRQPIRQLRTESWVRAITKEMEEAEVAEITGLVNLSSWPKGSRVLVRREELRPGARYNFFDPGGLGHQALITNSEDPDAAFLEARHRLQARVGDQIKEAKRTAGRRTSVDAASTPARCGCSRCS
jgi:hypothetical protein